MFNEILNVVTTYFSGPWGQLELVASILLIINVYLLARESIWNYLPGIIGVAIFGFIFQNAQLYSDMLLQWVYFIPIQIIGWYWWMNGGRGKNNLPITSMTDSVAIVTIASTLALWGALGYYMHNFTDAAFAYTDALIVSMSVVANVLLVKKYLESWIMWIAVDILAIYVYFQKELFVTSGLYVIFLCLATFGLVSWIREYRSLNKPMKFGR